LIDQASWWHLWSKRDYYGRQRIINFWVRPPFSKWLNPRLNVWKKAVGPSRAPPSLRSFVSLRTASFLALLLPLVQVQFSYLIYKTERIYRIQLVLDEPTIEFLILKIFNFLCDKDRNDGSIFRASHYVEERNIGTIAERSHG